MVKKLPIRVRMKPVIQALREGNKTYSELSGLGVPEKTLDRILKDYLEYLGLAEKKGRYWVWYEHKRVFQSKHDYSIALEHSRKLTLSTDDNLRLDQSNPYLALDLLVYNKDINDQCLLQHIKTGYYELFSLLQKYRKMMDDKGFSKESHFPKILSSYFDSVDSSMELFSAAISLQDKDKREGHIEDEKLKELLDLRDLLVGKIYAIVYAVNHGEPLLGYCDFCPNRNVTIKE
jgi:hypothetical protein